MLKRIAKIIKFGGSSVGSAERVKNVCRIILDRCEKRTKNANVAKIAVVVSAMQGVTDKLLALDFVWVKEKHLATAKELKVPAPIELLAELENVIKGIKLIGGASPMALDLVASFGERLSAALVAAALNQKSKIKNQKHNSKIKNFEAIAVDARDLIVTDDNFQNAAVDFLKTNVRIRNYFLKPKSCNLKAIPIITGFIGSTADGKTTTLGRGGSDYSAAIFGAALGADIIEIWTDVNGIMSADPRIVPTATTLPRASYEEAFEMAYFGAKVLHPPTILPAIKRKIPVLIKNTFNPNHPGTLITDLKNAKKDANDTKVVKNISSIDDVSLINIGGVNLAGVPGTAERVFGAIAGKKVNVILISQASSEQAICLVVKSSETEKAIAALKYEFEKEIVKGQVAVAKKDDQSIVAVVGDNMRGIPGVAGRVFNYLGKEKVNIAAIAQGSSERNISFVIDRADKNKAVAILHQEFFSDPDAAAVFVIGVGNVGSDLLRQMRGSGLRVCGIADIKKMITDVAGIDIANWRKVFQKSSEPIDLKQFLERAAAAPFMKKVLVDCTASTEVARSYPDFINKGFNIVTPNKKANVMPYRDYLFLRKALDENEKLFYYDANVGAGLPVISSVKKLLSVGDEIKKIEGIFSGTLSYLFNGYDGKRKFSALVQEARQKGYTEPDPREDLSGQDVGRKLLILAREMGLPAELSDVRLENLADYDDNYFARRYKKARAKNCVLRYVGMIANGNLSARLKEVPARDSLANVRGTDNVVAIYSNYYNENPLVIKGPGAGAKVTAAAVLDGIIKATKIYEK